VGVVISAAHLAVGWPVGVLRPQRGHERRREWLFSFLHRPIGKVALALLILNEIRGIVVVVTVVGAWLRHR
jgi:hypothetical protein